MCFQQYVENILRTYDPVVSEFIEELAKFQDIARFQLNIENDCREFSLA